jgi:hypothetical protein
MSRLFGSVRQIAFVVRDLDLAIPHWAQTLGVGPFFVGRHLSPEGYRYRGQPSQPPSLSIALANSGDLQVELIQQHDDRPSPFRDFLAAGQEGFQHVSSWLSRAGYDATLERQLAAGSVVAAQGVMPDSGVRFAYFDTGTGGSGMMYEIADVLEPEAYARMSMIADASKGWDGRNPVRELLVSRAAATPQSGEA